MNNLTVIELADDACADLTRLLADDIRSPLARLLEAIDAAWLDEPRATSRAVNAGAHLEDGEERPASAATEDGAGDTAGHQDPTGDAAVARANAAQHARRDIVRRVTQLARDVDALVGHCNDWSKPSVADQDEMRSAANNELNPAFCWAHQSADGTLFELTKEEIERNGSGPWRRPADRRLCRTCLDKSLALAREPALAMRPNDQRDKILVALLKINPGIPTTLDIERAAGLKRGTIKPPAVNPKGARRGWHTAEDYQLGDNVRVRRESA